MSNPKNKSWLTPYALCATALGSALIALCTWISIPATVPFTLQTFAVFLVAGLLGAKCGTLAVLIYLLLGAVGLPVFSGFQGGPGALLGVTGGYLIGFVFTALTVGLLTDRLGRRFPVLIGSMVLGLALCYTFGSAWFLILYTKTKGAMAMSTVLATCVLPFLLPDGLKLLLAAFLVRRLHGHIKAV